MRAEENVVGVLWRKNVYIYNITVYMYTITVYNISRGIYVKGSYIIFT